MIVLGVVIVIGVTFSTRVPKLAGQLAQSTPSWEVVRAKADPQYSDQRDFIPTRFGRLVAVDSRWESSGSGASWLWFEAGDGTIRVVSVSTKGKQSNYVWSVVKEFPRR